MTKNVIFESNTMSESSPDNEFVIAEYNACRRMIEINIESMEKLETFSIAASAAAGAFSTSLIKTDILDTLGNHNSIFSSITLAASNEKIYSIAISSHISLLFLLALSSSILPLLITFVGFLRFWALDKTIGTYNDYIRSIEYKYPKLGLTGYYRKRRDVNMASRTLTLMETRYILWGFLGIVYIIYFLFILEVSRVYILVAALIYICGTVLLVFRERCNYLREKTSPSHPLSNGGADC